MNPFRKYNQYRFSNSWRIDSPVETVWNKIVDSKNWHLLSSELGRIENIDNRSGFAAGSRFRSTWKGSLPYRIRFYSEIDSVIPVCFFSFKVNGDLEGEGKCMLSCSNGITVIVFKWRVRPTKYWMILLAPFARKYFEKNHNIIVDKGFNNLKSFVSENT